MKSPFEVLQWLLPGLLRARDAQTKGTICSDRYLWQDSRIPEDRSRKSISWDAREAAAVLEVGRRH